MYISHSGLYQEATLFDQLARATAKQLRGWMPRQANRRWNWAFRALGAGFALLAAGIVIQGVSAADSLGAGLVAVSATAGLLAAAQFFLSRPQARQGERRDVPSVTPRVMSSPPTEAVRPAAAGRPKAATDASPQAFLKTLKDAGVNVRIAKALFTAGIRSPEAVRRQKDANLLAIKGVGPATLEKLRQTFG